MQFAVGLEHQHLIDLESSSKWNVDGYEHLGLMHITVCIILLILTPVFISCKVRLKHFQQSCFELIEEETSHSVGKYLAFQTVFI